MAGVIKPIDGRSVHQIQSGQVITDLCSVVKELVENSLDAGSSIIDVRFKNQGLDLIEVQDNGTGISPTNHAYVALKHHTSKLSSFTDIASLKSFGFRGEALASLCALSNLTVITCVQADVPKGSRLSFDVSGALKESVIVASQRGTTVSVDKLFYNLPVRRREFERNIKREWQKVVVLLSNYASIQTNIKFSVTQQPIRGKRIVLLSTRGNPTVRENIINIFGAKTMSALVSLDLGLEMQPTPPRPEVAALAGHDAASSQVRIVGYVSRPTPGDGRHLPDRQMFFVNGRPCGLPQLSKTFNEVYRSHSCSQSPFIIVDVRLDTHMYDVNVSPDKRSVLFHDQSQLLKSLRTSLAEMFGSQDCAIPISQPSNHSRGARHHGTTPGQIDWSSDSSKPTTLTTIGDTLLSDEQTTSAYLHESHPGSDGKSLRQDSRSDKKKMLYTFGSDGSPASIGLNRHSTMASTSAYSLLGIEERTKTATHFDSNANTEVGSPAHDTEFHPPSQTAAKSDIVQLSLSKSQECLKDRSAGISMATLETTDYLKDCKAQPVIARTKNGIDEEFNLSLELHDCDAEHASSSPHPFSSEAPEALAVKFGDRRVEGDGNSLLMEEYHRNEIIQLGAVGRDAGYLPSNPANVQDAAGVPVTGDDALEIASRKYPHETQSARVSDQEQEIWGSTSCNYVDPINTQKSTQATQKIANKNTSYDNTGLPGREKISEPFRAALKPASTLPKSVQRVLVNEEFVRSRMNQCEANWWPTECEARVFDGIEKDGPSDVESKLSVMISREHFSQMRIIGQFNMGFIIAVRPATLRTSEHRGVICDELFIIDQHASDEKYNFEMLQENTKIQSQHLVHPRRLQLTALEEEIVKENLALIEVNGFKVKYDTSGTSAVGSRCHVIALPLSQETTFGLEDFKELIAILGDEPTQSGHIPRPSKVRKMFAMKACRSSVMIGKALTQHQMITLVRNMGELDKPWNCPHGRPTMRHLCGLQAWDGKLWKSDIDITVSSTWRSYSKG